MLASFVDAKDLPQVCELGILSASHLESFTRDRLDHARPWIEAFGSATGGGLSRNVAARIREAKPLYFVTNPEDFWGEERPQNIPGTWREYPNWRRKFVHLIEHALK